MLSPMFLIFIKSIQKEKELDAILLHLREKKFLISWVNPEKPEELKQLQKYFIKNKASDLLSKNKEKYNLPAQEIVKILLAQTKGK
ncbi:hypothetical protein MNB_ARC-1_964 [hydrothermal vent metagenome]|uniref:Uncharacterized protein n=1 Tax=hydrothermal vent metagenome TaxID=652676 RepID=A0A3B1DRK4_9ZZZZ